MPQTPTLPQFGTPPGGLSGVQLGANQAWHYNPPTEHLVRGQMKILRDENGDYMKQSKQGAMELANARGQANSSYAAGAAQRAAIDAALPIASQDSETLTKIGLTNAQNSQQQALIDAQRAAASSQGGGQIVYDMTGAEEADRQLQLQLQRERLAFEGEQAGLDRDQEYGMGLMGNEYGMYRGQQDFANQRQLGYDRYGQELGQMGQAFGYNSALARLGSDLGIRGNYYDNVFGSQRDLQRFGFDMQGSRMQLYGQLLQQGMQIPEYMADPEALLGFLQFTAGPQWDNILGGGR